MRVLTEHDLPEVMGDIPVSKEVWSSLGLPFKSDLIRTALLIRHGGIWMDPTVFPMISVHEWLETRMDAGVFAFSRPGRDRVISNWFIAAEPAHPVLTALMERLCSYWSSPWLVDRTGHQSAFAKILARALHRNLTLPRLWLTSPARMLIRHPPYLVYHYMVYDVLRTNRDLASLWQRMPIMSADSPHRLQRFGLQAPLTEAARQHVDYPETPLFKLTWKLPEPQIREGTVLDYLFARRSVGDV